MNTNQDAILAHQVHIQMKEIQNVQLVQMEHIHIFGVNLHVIIVQQDNTQMNIKQIVIIVLLEHIQMKEI